MAAVSEGVARCCGTDFAQSQDQGEKSGNAVSSTTAEVLGVEGYLAGHEEELQAFERPFRQ